MLQTQSVPEARDITRKNTAFRIVETNTATGETTIVIQKGIIGAMSNQLKNTSNRRKGSSILRRLGHMLSVSGDIQYGKKIEETNTDQTDITPHIVSGTRYADTMGETMTSEEITRRIELEHRDTHGTM